MKRTADSTAIATAFQQLRRAVAAGVRQQPQHPVAIAQQDQRPPQNIQRHIIARCLDLIGHAGPVIVEGPFARNQPFLWMLGAATSSPVLPMEGTTGTSQGAAMLAGADRAAQASSAAIPAPDARVAALLSDYARDWDAATAGG